MLFHCYVNVAVHLFQRPFMALFVREFTFATQFCDVLIVCFCIFYLNAVFLRFQALLFSLCPSLHCTRSFAAPSATKNSVDGSSEPIRAVPLCGLESYFFALAELGITQSATPPPKNMAQRIAEQSKEARPLAKPSLLLFCPPSFMRHLSI